MGHHVGASFTVGVKRCPIELALCVQNDTKWHGKTQRKQKTWAVLQGNVLRDWFLTKPPGPKC